MGFGIGVMELVGVIRVGRLESVGVGGMVMVGGNVVRIDVEITVVWLVIFLYKMIFLYYYSTPLSYSCCSA